MITLLSNLYIFSMPATQTFLSLHFHESLNEVYWRPVCCLVEGFPNVGLETEIEPRSLQGTNPRIMWPSDMHTYFLMFVLTLELAEDYRVFTDVLHTTSKKCSHT